MKHGDVIYDKLDGRKMIIMEVTDIGSQKMFRCRYYSSDDQMVTVSFYEFELRKTKPNKLGFLSRNK